MNTNCFKSAFHTNHKQKTNKIVTLETKEISRNFVQSNRVPTHSNSYNLNSAEHFILFLR
jgi:hypothetical protein